MQTVDLELAVADVDEAATVNEIALVNTISETAISAELVANQVNVSETVNAGTVIATFSATDPEGNTLNYSLSGTGSELMTVNNDGEVILNGNLDYETNPTLVVTLEVSDGTHTTTEEITINVVNDNEPAIIAATLSATSFAENTAVGASIASINATDPEGSAVTYTLSGTGSDNFNIDTNGNITLANTLDYETVSSYELTIVVDEGTYASTEVVTVSVADVNEAPSLSTSVAFNAFQENTATGTTIATSTVTDPEAGAITYSLSGTGSENFAVSSDGTVTLANSLDYETATAYEITLTANDGANSVSQTITVNVGDINEAPTVSATLAASSFAEDVSTGTTIATSSASDPESSTVTYSLSGTGSDNFSVDANGNVTVASSLDYETTTSYSLTLTASDGTNSTQETITFNITDVDEFALALSSTSPSINEGVSTGTQVATSTLTQQDSASVTYSLSGTGSDKFAISSTGVITTAAAMDYETTSSYSLTVTVTDGTNTDTETINISINDLSINTLATTLANSGAALAESSSSGTAVASSSISNPDSETITYTLSGTGSSNFSVDSSGNVTTNATLDFETAQSYALTLTATAGSTSVTDTFTVNVGNVEELNSAVLRYSAAYNSASRTGFSATATRGPSGSSLPAYYLEQIGTTATSVIADVDNISNNSVPVEIAGGSALNWRYFFPIDTTGAGQYAFAPNSASVDAKYKSLLGTNVTTTISNSEVITAGRFSGGNFWFMATDKAAQNISYSSSTGGGNAIILFSENSMSGNASGDNQWMDALTAAGFSTTSYQNPNALPSTSGVDIIIDMRYGQQSQNFSSDLATFVNNGGTLFDVVYENNGCCGTALADLPQAISILNGMGLSGNTLADAGSRIGGNVGSRQYLWPYQSISGGSYDYNAKLSGKNHYFLAAQRMTLPTGCANLAGDGAVFVCDPGFSGNTFLGFYFGMSDFNSTGDESQIDAADVYDYMEVVVDTASGSATTSTYNLFEDQVTLAGRVYTDAMLTNLYSSSPYQGTRHVFAYAVIPIENFTPSGTSNDYLYPNFIPTNLWSYGDLGVDYCQPISGSNCTTYDYEWSSYALDHNNNIGTTRFSVGANYVPMGQSLWWQVVYPPGGGNGVSVGLWAQISFKDSYDGASGSTTRDDQESLLNVVISTVDYRKHDTTRYSAGDTGLGMDGYHYWSYQGATNANNDGLGINYGTSAIECATSNDSGCFWADGGTDIPRAAMITSSDPYKSGDMTLSVNYNSNTDTFSTGSFNAAIIQQDIRTSTGTSASVNIGSFRTTDFHQSNHNASCGGCHSGFFSGILEFDVSGSGNSQLASMRSSSTLATFNFDYNYDYMQVVAPMTISAAPANNYTSNWTTVDTGSMTLKFGDATNDEAKSAFISAEVFGAEIQDDGAQIDGTSGGSNNLAGVMVSYNTLDNVDGDLFHNGGNDIIPDTAYSTWGFWAMSSVDISPNTGDQNASVHLGTWVSGQTLTQNEIPTSGSASMSGAAVMNVAYRYNQTGTNYDVHKYTTTADVAASFTWGASGYSGSLDFTNFDDKNAIVANAGFTAFTVAITGTDHTYTGNSTTSLQNDWLGGASVAGALYGGTSPDESGGRINVNLYKSGDIGTAGANDFYMAEGIYLID